MKVIRSEEIGELEYNLIEIDIMSKIDNPYINKLIDYFFDEDKETGQEKLVLLQPLAMCDLQQFLTQFYPEGQMPESQAIEFLAQLAVGIKVIHDNKVIHRDINPRNILVCKNEKKTTLNDQEYILKISDFGCSKILEPHEYQALTLTGKINYMAPEQLSNSDMGYNSKVDIYALGLTVFQMITGHVMNSGEIFARKIKNQQYSTQFMNFLYKLCSLDHVKRPSIDEIIQDPIFQKSHTFIYCLLNDILPMTCPTIESAIDYLKDLEQSRDVDPSDKSLGEDLDKQFPFLEERLNKPLQCSLPEIARVFYQMNKVRTKFSDNEELWQVKYEQAIGNNDEQYIINKLQQIDRQNNNLESLNALKDSKFKRIAYETGNILVGFCKKDRIEGFSQAKSYTNLYVGYFKNGYGFEYAMNSQGIQYYFDGQYVDSEQSGHGVMIYSDGDMFSGEFKNGDRHGLGIYYWSFGDIYEGNWVKNKKNGNGIQKYADGEILKGTWKDDKKHGEFIRIQANGNQDKVIFEQGKEIQNQEIIST
eukprot:403362044